MISYGIVSQVIALHMPQQNGVAERKCRTILDMVHFMIIYSSLLNSFWEYSIQTVVYILNNVSSKFVPETPHEL